MFLTWLGAYYVVVTGLLLAVFDLALKNDPEFIDMHLRNRDIIEIVIGLILLGWIILPIAFLVFLSKKR